MTNQDLPPSQHQAAAAQQISPRHHRQGLSIAEASKRLGRTPDTIRRWIAAGKLRAEVVQRPQGKAYRVYLDEPAAEPPKIEGDAPETDQPRVEGAVPADVDADTDQAPKQDAPQSIDPNQPLPGLSTAEAGQRLGRSSVTIRQWIAAGKLRAEVVQRPHGKAYRVYLDEADVEALRRAGAVPATVGDDTDQVKDDARASQTIDPNQPLPGLSIREASQRLGRSRQTIRRWIAAGKLRAEVIERPQGKAYRVYLDEPAAEPPKIEGDVPADVVLSFIAGLRAELERRAAEVRERDATIATLQRDVQDLRALTGFLTGVVLTWTRPPTETRPPTD